MNLRVRYLLKTEGLGWCSDAFFQRASDRRYLVTLGRQRLDQITLEN